MYELTRKPGIKNINMRVKPTGVFVSAPKNIPQSEIDGALLSRLDWLLNSAERIREREQFAETPPPDMSPDFLDGLKIFLSGEEFVLEMCGGGSAYEKGGVVFVPEKNPDVELLKFISGKVRARYETYLEKYLTKSGFSGVKPDLSIAFMKSRWGHYKRHGSLSHEIMLNFALAPLPERYADYVTAHEVAHIFVPNHSAEFYALGERLLPGFRVTDRELNRFKIDFWGNLCHSAKK